MSEAVDAMTGADPDWEFEHAAYAEVIEHLANVLRVRCEACWKTPWIEEMLLWVGAHAPRMN